MAQKTIVYTMPGLGLAPSIYENLTIEADEVHHLKWLDPHRKESLNDYAARVAQDIDTSQGPVILIGHSFGGIIMQEVSKIVPTRKVILLSSIKSEKEKPATLSFWFKVFPVYQLGTQKSILNSFGMWGKAHGYNTPAAQAAFRTAVATHSNYYFRWATQQVCKWKKSGNYPAPIVHIHGTDDKTFPHRKIKPPLITIKNGSHVMLHTCAEEISTIINAEIAKTN